MLLLFTQPFLRVSEFQCKQGLTMNPCQQLSVLPDCTQITGISLRNRTSYLQQESNVPQLLFIHLRLWSFTELANSSIIPQVLS